MTSRIARLRQRPDPSVVKTLERLIGQVVRGLDMGEDCGSLVAEINAISGQDYEPEFFFELEGWTSAREVAEVAARGVAQPIPDLSREELTEVILIIEEGREPECSFFLTWLERCFPRSGVSDLIYYPHRHLSADDTAEEILYRRDLDLRGGPEAVSAHEIALAREVLRDPNAAVWSRQWAENVLRATPSQETGDG